MTGRKLLAPMVLATMIWAAPATAGDSGAPAEAVTAKPLTPSMPAQPTLPLKIVSKEQFCSRLQQYFTGYGAANGFDRVQTALLASNAASALVAEFRAGRATDYINAAALAALANAPDKTPQGTLLPTAGFLGDAMGLGQNVTLALSAGELRYIPFAQHGLDMVLIAQNAASLTPERARKVAEVATQSQIHIHVLWVGGPADQPMAIDDARMLAWLAAVTGGAFANLSGTTTPCANQL